MVQLIVIAGFVLIHLRDMAGGGWPQLRLEGWAAMGLTCIPLVGLTALVWISVIRVGRKIDETGRPQLVERAEMAVSMLRVMTLGWYTLSVFGWNWPGAVRRAVGDLVLVDEALTILPLITAVVLASYIIYPIERRLRDAVLARHLDEGRPINRPWSRREYVWSMVRHQVLFVLVPVSIISAWGEVVAWGALRMGWADDRAGIESSLWVVGAQLAGVIVILALMPLAMRIVWDTVPLADGPLRERLIDICRRYGVRVRNLLVWRTHGTMINGAAMGIVGPARYILLSDALLESLTGPQVEAVAAHEVAHVRHKHTLWLALAMLATVTLTAAALGLGGELLAPIIPRRYSQTVATVGSLVAGVLIMGLFSRRFEWQADAFAAKHMARVYADSAIEPDLAADGGPVITAASVGAMTGALQSVADLNGIPRERPSFRHGSIAARQRRLNALIGWPVGPVPIDSEVWVLRLATLAGLAAAGIAIALGAAVL
ncbi:MAG: M48 family metalloprotease [Phycisphaerales bacterium]|nr:M48 family metalloprotease [Phycisphaerales bacterium]